MEYIFEGAKLFSDDPAVFNVADTHASHREIDILCSISGAGK